MTDCSIQLFQFESQEIRFIDGKPVANDVASVLGYADPATAVYRKVAEKNRSLAEIATGAGKRMATVLEEAGIYQLIFSSKLASAERFQDWVFEEVLPQIRKPGSYSVQSPPKTVQLRLPAHKLAEEIAESIFQIQNKISDNNPRLAQFLIDLAISEVMPAGNCLTGSKLKGVAEIAESLGLAVDLKNRSLLGKFVKKSCGHLAKQEERLVNGQQRSVACYPEDDPEVIEAIRAFFS